MLNSSSLSILNARLQVCKKHLLQIINTKVDHLLGQLPPQKVDLGTVSMKKNGDLDLTIIGKEIQLRIPMNFYFNGKKLLSWVAAQAGIELLFISEVNLDTNWQLSTKSTLAHYIWLEAPDIQVPGLNFSVEKIANQFLEKNKSKIEDQIDVSISNYWKEADVQNLVETFFDRSFPIRANWPVFLHISPLLIQLSPVESNSDFLHSQLSSQLRIDITSEAGKESLPPPPSLSLAAVEKNEPSHLDINTSLSYESLEFLLRDQLIGQSFSYGERTISFTDLHCKKSEQGIQLNVNLSGYIDGLVKLDCLPIYYESENFITMKIQNFRLNASSLWKQGMVNLFSGKIRAELERRLSYPLAELHLIEEIQKLKEFSPMEGVTAKISLSEIKLRNFIVGEYNLSFALCTKADVKVFYGNDSNFANAM